MDIIEFADPLLGSFGDARAELADPILGHMTELAAQQRVHQAIVDGVVRWTS